MPVHPTTRELSQECGPVQRARVPPFLLLVVAMMLLAPAILLAQVYPLAGGMIGALAFLSLEGAVLAFLRDRER